MKALINKLIARWTKPKPLTYHEKILQGLALWIPEATLKTEVSGYELDFILTLPDNKGEVTFSYNAIRECFYGHISLWANGTYVFDYLSFFWSNGESRQYRDVLKLVLAQRPEIHNLVQDFKVAYANKQKTQRVAKNSYVESLTKKD